MKKSIQEANQVIEEIRNKIAQTRKDTRLTKQGKAETLTALNKEMKDYLKHWEGETADAKQKISEALAEIKPATNGRVLDETQFSLLDYQAKIMHSRLAAEGSTGEDFLKILQEYIDEGTDISRQAYLDNYSSFAALADTFDHTGKDNALTYYRRAKNKMKTPEQLEYEEKVQAATNESHSHSSTLTAVERNLQEVQNSIATEVWGADKENEKESTPWT